MGRALRGVADEIGRVEAREILRWVQWAFTREPWSESGVGRMVESIAITGVMRREAPATHPAIPALVRKPKLLAEPAVDDDAPTYEDAPPTIPVPRVDSTQLVPRVRSRILMLIVLVLGGLIAYGAWTMLLGTVST
jgi:hypothetical protein